MHYFIDGYNLLFYLYRKSSADFQSQRESLINTLNFQIDSLELDVTIVFDSYLTPDEETRTHFHHLEVIYTSQGITADDYIIQRLNNCDVPTREVIVTNDQDLSMRARHLSASTQNIETFIHWLERRHKNKVQKRSGKKLIKQPTPSDVRPKTPRETPKFEQSTSTEPTLVIEIGTFEYYLAHFQEAHEKMLALEKSSKKEKIKKLPKQKLSSLLFDQSKESPPQVSEMERWLKIFEEGRNKDR